MANFHVEIVDGEYHVKDDNGMLWEIHDNPDDADNAVDRLADEQEFEADMAEDVDEDFMDPPVPEVPLDPNKPHPWGIFTDHAQANQHLACRMVIYDGRMLYVKQVLNLAPGQEKGKLICNKPSGGNRVELDVDDPLFNRFRFDPLGWINSENGAVLAYLRPIRQTHRGYGEENVGLLGIRQGYMDRPDDVRVYDLFSEPGCEEMLRNEYPVFDDVAKELLVREGMGIAISRQYALSSDSDGYVWLWVDGQRVALISDPLTVALGKRFGYLREQLQECGLFEGVWIK